MKAIGYVRVSSEEQRREGVSLDAQREKIRQYAQLNDMELVGIEADEGISGKSIKARPGIQRIIGMVKERSIDSVIVYKLDRLCRNTVEALEFSKMCDKHGVALHSITERLDTRSAIGGFFFTLMASLAEMERRLIGERTAFGIQHKRSNGQNYSSRYALYGYQKRDGVLLPVEHEQQAIALVMRLRGKYGLAETARRLTAAGYRTRSGAQWYRQTVKGIIEDAAKREEINEAIQARKAA